MSAAHEDTRVGIAYLDAVTALLRRVRRAHPTRGLFEAADLQWWWRTPRPTDGMPQLFWFDEQGRPEAAVIVTEWRDHLALDPLVLPDATPGWVAYVVARGLAHADAHACGAVELEVDQADTVLQDVLTGHGFGVQGDGVVETWLAAADRAPVSPLPAGYRLTCRLDTSVSPHHLVGRSGPGVEARLRQTSLYRPDLDLVVVDDRDQVAAYGLFWFDPELGTGLVEPMRTEDEHQGRGLARHVLTAGLDRLVAAGAIRIKICFEPDNAAARTVYLGAGFVPCARTDVFAR